MGERLMSSTNSIIIMKCIFNSCIMTFDVWSFLFTHSCYIFYIINFQLLLLWINGQLQGGGGNENKSLCGKPLSSNKGVLFFMWNVFFFFIGAFFIIWIFYGGLFLHVGLFFLYMGVFF